MEGDNTLKKRYFVISVKLNKHLFSKKVLFLIKADSEERCLNGFEFVRNKLPFLDKMSPFVYEYFDLSDREEYLEFVTKYREYIIYLKINHSFGRVFYLSEIYVKVSDLIYHEVPMSIIHIQTKSSVTNNSDWMKKKSLIEKEIESSLAFNDLTFSIIEISKYYDWNNIEMWETILKTNDIGVIFYESSINDIIKLSKILVQLSSRYNHFLFVYFVDEKRNLYYIIIGDTIEIIPFKREDIVIG